MDKLYLALFFIVIALAVVTSPISIFLGAIYGAFRGAAKGAMVWVATISHTVLGYP